MKTSQCATRPQSFVRGRLRSPRRRVAQNLVVGAMAGLVFGACSGSERAEPSKVEKLQSEPRRTPGRDAGWQGAVNDAASQGGGGGGDAAMLHDATAALNKADSAAAHDTAPTSEAALKGAQDTALTQRDAGSASAQDAAVSLSDAASVGAPDAAALSDAALSGAQDVAGMNDAAALVCEVDETRCQGAAFQSCAGHGLHWQTMVHCLSASLCDENAGCEIPFCVPGDLHCNGSKLIGCSKKGIKYAYFVADMCLTPALCNAQRGVCEPPVCEPGQTRCEGVEVQVCGKYRDRWEAVESCSSAALCNATEGCLRD